ncbi:hypothetical protein, partial [Aphanothece microscopica]
MTASETWLNNVRADKLLGALLLALAVTGCGPGEPDPKADPKAAAPRPVAAPAPVPPPPTKPESTGLTLLPSANEVLAGFRMGRDDPFAPFVPVAAAGTTRPRLNLPAAFRFSGVIRSAGASQAIVEYGGNAGVLSVGERGGRNTDLLPSGWSVAAIDVDR